MRILILFLSLAFAMEVVAQEPEQVSSGTTSLPFRSRSLTFEKIGFSDGTYTNTYRDDKGDPLSEMERNYVDGILKSSSMTSRSEAYYKFIAETDASSFTPLIAYGEHPEFQAFTGITLEQINQIILAQWDSSLMPFIHPSDEILDIYVRAGRTDDAAELEGIGMELWMKQMKEHEQLNEIMAMVLLPEQRHKLRELQWIRQTIQDENNKKEEEKYEGVTYGHPLRLGFYKSLDLSAEQQQRLESLKTEYFQALSEHFKTVRSGKETMSLKKINEISETIQPKLEAMLTEAQKAKMAQLLDNKPNFLTAAPTPKKTEDYKWLDFWKPGDPIPEGRIPPLPPSRFPRL